MIHLKKGDILKDNPALVVYDPTGYYRDEDSVICASVSLPEEPVCRFEAKYVAYGGIVYSISNPEELMAEVLKIDPETLFGKTNENIAVNKMVQEIIPQESGEAQQSEPEEIVEEDVTIPTDTSTSTSTSTSTPTTSTTTPEIILPEEPIISPAIEPTSTTTSTTTETTTATTTPEVVIEPIPVTPTSTPDIAIPPITETSTTTASIVE